MHPLPLLGEPHHGGTGGEILRLPIQRIPWGHSGIPTLPHHFRHVERCSYQTLGDIGGRGGGGTVRIW